jgi:hypothetical protein
VYIAPAAEDVLGASAVQQRFGVSGKSAREWLKRWREAGYIEPARPGAQRIHSFRLASAWLWRLAVEEA